MKINVGVFFGGSSVEHEISVISALQAMDAIDKTKYSVVPVYISKDGQFYTGEALTNIENYKDMNKLLSGCQAVTLLSQPDGVVLQKQRTGIFGKSAVARIDVAFPVVHGTNCEDGTLQGYLELLRIPYVGCDVLSSAVGMDKIIMKKVMKESGLPVLDYVNFYTKEWHTNSVELISTIESKIGYPVIVKPANLGSSVGIKKAGSRRELEDAVSLAQSFSGRIIVERAVTKLKEVNCSVLGDYEKAEASACEEPISSDEILSYKDKYMNKGGGKGMSVAMRKLPAEIPQEMEKQIKELAVRTFKVLGCGGVARIDFLIDTGDNTVYVNEINTIPGSLSFYLWEACGKSFTQLTDQLISLALKREREKKELMFTYDTNILAMHGGAKGAKGAKG